MSIKPNSKATGVPCLCLCLPGFSPLWSMLHKNPDSLGWMSYCTWNKSSDNTQAPTFLFDLKEEKKKKSKLVPVMFALGWAIKIKPRVVVASDFTFFWSVEVAGQDSVLALVENGVSKATIQGKNLPLPHGPCWDAPAFLGCSSGKHLGFQPQESAPHRPSASKFTHNQGSLNKNAIKIMELFSCGR